MKYKKIISALSICPSAFEGSEEFYKRRFTEFIKTYDFEFRNELRIEMLRALQDKDWSWKDACEKVDFYSYDPYGSEKDHLDNIKEIIWDPLFQNL
jgi:hypothetical protein